MKYVPYDWKNAFKKSAEAAINLWFSGESLYKIKENFARKSGCSPMALTKETRQAHVIMPRFGFCYLLKEGLQLSHKEVAVRTGYNSPGQISYIVKTFTDNAEIEGVSFPQRHPLSYPLRNVCRVLIGRDWGVVPKAELLATYAYDLGLSTQEVLFSKDEISRKARQGFFYLGTKERDLFTQQEIMCKYSIYPRRGKKFNFKNTIDDAISVYRTYRPSED